MEAKSYFLYHMPGDIEPTVRVDGINRFGTYVVRTQVLGRQLPDKFVGDLLPAFDWRANRSFKRAVKQAKSNAYMILEQPDSVDLI